MYVCKCMNVYMYTTPQHSVEFECMVHVHTCKHKNERKNCHLIQHNFLTHTILFLLLFLKCSTREIDAIFSFKTIFPSYVWHRMLEMLLHFTTHDNQITIVQCYIFHHFSTCFWMKHKASCATKRVGKDGDIHLML